MFLSLATYSWSAALQLKLALGLLVLFVCFCSLRLPFGDHSRPRTFTAGIVRIDRIRDQAIVGLLGFALVTLVSLVTWVNWER
ncbi:hypothetical protein AYI85_12455 [Shewanella algae]|nr:hypothetical protein AYI85_12455 [Shewanella algae]TVL02103.1 hypothetical protein AYI84_13715 [Shewanella algae]TVL53350.1 hypothetical protein AYI99_07185 [Shewanella algae]